MNMRLENIFWILFYIFVGGAAFWSPDVLLHAYRGYGFSGRDSLLLSVLLPWALVACYGILLWLRGGRGIAPSIAFFMLVGVWILGSLGMMIGASFSGGGFAMPGAEVWVVIALGILPPYTFIMATYDGSLLGLLVATVLMVLMHVRYEKEHWILPARLRKLRGLSNI